MALGKVNQKRGRRGFTRAGALVQSRIKTASETRGFAESRLLTHWAEIAGPDVADRARPVEVTYGRGFGATLVLLTTGAHAPILEMQKDALRDKVNACYGYAAISRIRITQTAPTGFAEGQVAFQTKPSEVAPRTPDITPRIRDLTDQIEDDDLRSALDILGANITSRKSE